MEPLPIKYIYMRLNEINDKSYIGVDLDGTLAFYDGYEGMDKIGKPIKPMVNRVKRWIKQGKNVKIFTARATNQKAHKYIKAWCKEHLGRELPITCQKDRFMIELWDDRARQVKTNTGIEVRRQK
mgnify:CR=1 FL=1